MAKRYTYKLDYIVSLLERVNKALESGNLSEERESFLLGDKETLEHLLKRDYRFYKPYKVDKTISLTEAKERYIRILKEAAKGISREDRAFFRALYDSKIFYETTDYTRQEMPTDTIIDLSLDTYKRYSPSLLPDAKHLFEDPNTPHVVIAKKVQESVTEHISVSRDSFILHNPDNHPNVLIHEMQHAIEYGRGIDDSQIGELGPMYYELLFLKELKKQSGITLIDPITERIDETACHLPIINAYFILMDTLEGIDGPISDKLFVELIMNVMNFETKKEAIEHIYDDPGEDLNEFMDYVVSFLKAIEALYYTKTLRKDRFPYIERELKKKQVELLPQDEAFHIYNDFVNKHDKGSLRF